MTASNAVHSVLLHAKVLEESAWPDILGVLGTLSARGVSVRATPAFVALTAGQEGLGDLTTCEPQ